MGDAADDAYDQYIEQLATYDALTCNCPGHEPDWEEDDDGLLTCRRCGLSIEL